MAYESLQAVVGTAVIDSVFRSALLNGSRRSAVENFDLTQEETNAVMAIRAETLAQFAAQLHQWILRQQNQVEPPALSLLTQRHYALDREHAETQELTQLSSLTAALVA